MYYLWKICKATACDWGCQSLCVFTVRKCSILSQIHVLVFVTEHSTPVTLQINIRCIFWGKVLRQQHVTGVAITLCFHCAEIPYLVTDTCSGVCDWTWDSSYIANNIWCIFCEKVVRQQHVTGVAHHFVFSLCGNAVSCHRCMFWWLWLNMRLQLHCNYRFNVIFAKKL
jgi:hypothetical protein